MNLKEKIKIDLDKSLKTGEKLTLSTLRLLFSAIGNKEIEKRTKTVKKEKDLSEKELIKKSQLEDSEIIQLILSEIKKRKEAISLYQQGNRKDLVDKEEKETEILKKYLPEQILDGELKKITKDTIEKVGASSLKDMGRVMKELMPKIKGRVEGSKVSQVVKELLSK